MYEDLSGKPVEPLSSLFTGSEAAKVIDFILSKEKEHHSTMAEIHTGTKASMTAINKIIDNLLDIDAIGIGARRIEDINNNDNSKDKYKDENTYYIRDDTDTGKSIRDLWYHLMQVKQRILHN
jgi:hypothetical protein